MNVDIKDVITLSDGNKYVVVSKVLFQDNTYFYILDVNNHSEFKILVMNQEDGKLLDFDNPELIRELLPLFLEESVKHVPEITE